MDIDNKMIMDLAKQMGMPAEQNGAAMAKARQKAGQYQNKSDEELVREILKMKEALKKDQTSFKKQIAAIKAFGSMMQGEQKERLQKIIELLES